MKTIRKLRERLVSFGRHSTCPICKKNFHDCQHTFLEARSFLERKLFVAEVSAIAKAQ
jgi:hypothetical protein